MKISDPKASLQWIVSVLRDMLSKQCFYWLSCRESAASSCCISLHCRGVEHVVSTEQRASTAEKLTDKKTRTDGSVMWAARAKKAQHLTFYHQPSYTKHMHQYSLSRLCVFYGYTRKIQWYLNTIHHQRHDMTSAAWWAVMPAEHVITSFTARWRNAPIKRLRILRRMHLQTTACEELAM